MSLFGLRLRRRRQNKGDLPAPYKIHLDTPMPPGNTAFKDLELVCLDIETTGLDPTSAAILSIGWVVIARNRVDLSTCEHCVVRPEQEVGDSASIHGLTDTLVEAGQDCGIVIDRAVEALTGRILVVHHAGLDKKLLDRECRARYGGPLLVPVVDTLALEHRRRSRQHHVGGPDSLRLPDLRDHYHLPWYSGHNALSDAIATAELLLAMVERHDGADRTRLKDLVA